LPQISHTAAIVVLLQELVVLGLWNGGKGSAYPMRKANPCEASGNF